MMLCQNATALTISDVENVQFLDRPAQEVGPEDVLLEVEYVGLCGSDLNTYKGLNPLVTLPRIPGHEIAGRIASVGAHVPCEFATGSSVIVVPYTACGKCTACRQGRPNACRFNKTLGVQQDGGLSKHVVLPYSRLILNRTLSAVERALVEPLSVGFHAVDRGRVQAGETVVVFGAGMIGLGAIISAQDRQANVIVIEPSQAKLPTLKALGVSTVIDPLNSDVIAEIDSLTKSEGANIAIEAVGLPTTFRQAVDVACFGGRVVYVGYAKDEVSYNTSLFNLKELDILGSRNATSEDFEHVISCLENRRELQELLVSKVFPWAKADRAFSHWDKNRDQTFKVMISVEEEEA